MRSRLLIPNRGRRGGYLKQKATSKNRWLTKFGRDYRLSFPASRRDEILERFTRLHTCNVFSGYGLGLANCKAIVERQGWRVLAAASLVDGFCFENVFARAKRVA
jgi:light-regulated signal transduction histidine kinase (bacteriophytochrome)